MTKFLLIIHIVAAILAVGPVAIAASMFPAAARAGSDSVKVLYRICRVYTYIAIAVPFFGLATAGSMRVFGSAWVQVSIGLTAVAALVLALVVLPGQRKVLAGQGGPTMTLAMSTGVFNVLWVVVTVLMVIRPGSTIGG
ncbi:hypothetical protein [Actinocrispum wychmicini]|uniref:Integral membrane protein DUF2269 n=1 Tax=Actinocrispum wychmicini TaxID=1213861 RepID=A0A4R2IN40_9PSEU|nr:hypothetical protein [Actinocrispum wychmicini]TCO46463.1 hypothetical protein EV192_11942 [Actinocrispum wychmicini]